MIIVCPVSLGELVDKISILEIKQMKILNAEKIKYINEEHAKLKSELDRLQLKDIASYLNRIKQVNLELWDIEDKIREKEKKKEFDLEFIELARSVYMTNDRRFDIKNEINSVFGSVIKEMKSYEEWK